MRIVLLLTLLAVSCDDRPAPSQEANTVESPDTALPPTPRKEVQEAKVPRSTGPPDGEMLYRKKCRGCHGTADKRGKVGPDLFASVWDDPALERARQVIAKGAQVEGSKARMPAFADKLTPPEIEAILTFIKKSSTPLNNPSVGGVEALHDSTTSP